MLFSYHNFAVFEMKTLGFLVDGWNTLDTDIFVYVSENVSVSGNICGNEEGLSGECSCIRLIIM